MKNCEIQLVFNVSENDKQNEDTYKVIPDRIFSGKFFGDEKADCNA